MFALREAFLDRTVSRRPVRVAAAGTRPDRARETLWRLLDRPEVALEEIARTMRPGGECVVTTPRRDPEGSLGAYHCREYTAGELASALRTVFGRVTVYPFQPARVSRLYERRLLGRKVARVALNVFAAAGINPLAIRGPLEDEAGYTQLCACAWKVNQ